MHWQGEEPLTLKEQCFFYNYVNGIHLTEGLHSQAGDCSSVLHQFADFTRGFEDAFKYLMQRDMSKHPNRLLKKV